MQHVAVAVACAAWLHGTTPTPLWAQVFMFKTDATVLNTPTWHDGCVVVLMFCLLRWLQSEALNWQAAYKARPPTEAIVFIVGGSTYEEAKVRWGCGCWGCWGGGSTSCLWPTNST